MNQPLPVNSSAFVTQLDPQQIALLRGLRKGTLLPQLLRTYREQAVRQIEDLRTAAATDDAETVRLIAHTLKSASFSIGANGIGELCGQLETNARAGQMGSNATLCGELVERFTALSTEIEQYLTP